MIDAVNLTKNFESIQALDDVSFHVEKGEILGFLGPNGAGKTTTMRILTCYFPPSSGSARIDGFDCVEQSTEVRRRVGYLPENVPLYPEMSVLAYLDFVAGVKGVPGAERKKRIGEVMDACNLTSVAERATGKLSKGYRQRVGLAQAIISKPHVLILDEPTVGLDPVQLREVRAVIRGLAENATIILSTHIMQEVREMCGRVIIINKGKIVAVDTPENLEAHLQKLTRLKVAVDGPGDKVTRLLRDIKGVEKVEAGQDKEYTLWVSRDLDVRREVASKVVAQDWGLLLLQPMNLSLEEIYVQMIDESTAAAPPAEPQTKEPVKA
ncbi:MAG: ABC transporter ATP-binding protein [Candidatus Xenobia bacterium]